MIPTALPRPPTVRPSIIRPSVPVRPSIIRPPVPNEDEDPSSIEDLLNIDIVGHIFKNASPFDISSLALVSKMFYSSYKKYGSWMLEKHGTYVLSDEQNQALRWYHRITNTPGSELMLEYPDLNPNLIKVGYDASIPDLSFHQLRAPPSWGKTAFSLATFMDLIDRGKKVWLIVPPKMVPGYEKELTKMYPHRWDSGWSPDDHEDFDEYKIMFIQSAVSPAQNKIYSQENQDILRGNQLNSCLFNCPALIMSNRLFINIMHSIKRANLNGPQFELPSYFIVDEAHVFRTLSSHHHGILTNLSSTRDTHWLMMSANEIGANIYKGLNSNRFNIVHTKIQFELENLESYIPDRADELHFVPVDAYELANPDRSSGYRNLLTAVSRSSYKPDRYGDLLDKLLLTGRSVIFGKKLMNDGISLSGDHYGERHTYRSGGRKLESLRQCDEKNNPVLYITYAQGSEGLNIDMVSNLVVLRPDLLNRKKYFQTVHRTLRVKNRTESVRVINVLLDNIDSYIRYRINCVSDDFVEEYLKVRGLKNEPTIKITPTRLQFVLRHYSGLGGARISSEAESFTDPSLTKNPELYAGLQKMSNDEVYLLFHTGCKKLTSWVKTTDHFSGPSPDSTELSLVLTSRD